MNVLANWSSASWEQARDALKRDILNIVTAINADDASEPDTPIVFQARDPKPAIGQLTNFSDSTTTTWGATVTGGGTSQVLARYNGSNWTVVGK